MGYAPRQGWHGWKDDYDRGLPLAQRQSGAGAGRDAA
jgi:hypothetical protein